MEIKFIEDKTSIVDKKIVIDPTTDRSSFKKQIKKSDFYDSLPKDVRKTMGTRDFFVAAKLADDYGKKAFNYFARLMPNNVHAELSEDEAFQSLPEDCQASVENYVHGFEQYAHKVYRPDIFSDPSQPAFIIDLDAENDDAFTA